jgi:hypothetical protein
MDPLEYNNKSKSIDLSGQFKNIMKAYDNLGYPPELIQQWTLPEIDTKTLIEKISEFNPQNILEI